MSRLPKTRIFAALSATMLASCAPATGTPVDRKAGPTVVSLNPCLDDILVNVADPDQILALSHYSRDPSASSVGVDVAEKYGVTGGTAEEVLALKPDIVLASTFMPATTKAAFERLGLRVETFGSPATMEESVAQVRRLAVLVGDDEKGLRLTEKMTATPEPKANREWTALIWQPGQIVPGEATLVSEHLRWAGLTNYGSEQELSQADFVSLEALLAEPPDIVLVAGDRPGQKHPLLDRQKGMLVADFDARLLFCGGPTIPKARERLLEIRAEFESSFWRARES